MCERQCEKFNNPVGDILDCEVCPYGDFEPRAVVVSTTDKIIEKEKVPVVEQKKSAKIVLVD